jgi:hypothetical protein
MEQRLRLAILTEKAAEEDARRVLAVVGRHIYSQFGRLGQLPPVVPAAGLELMGDLEVFRRTAAALGLGVHPSIKLTEWEERKPAAIPLIEDWFIDSVKRLYSYARYGHEELEPEIQEFRWDIAGLLFSFPVGELEPWFKLHLDLLETYLPRLTYALRVVDARLEMSLGAVSAESLARLADVTYTYILKLIKQGTLRAEKEHGEWKIPADEARRWLESRAARRR